MNTELVVFDWDGTLMDSAAKIVCSMQSAFSMAGASDVSESDVRDIIGLALDVAVERLLKVEQDEQNELVREIVCNYRDQYARADVESPVLFNGVVETLQGLADKGCLLAVATGKSRSGLDRALKDTGIGEYFMTSRCADECFSKPHPQMLTEISDELGMDGDQMLMVGDSEWDILMAKNANVRSIGVSYGVHNPERLSGLGAHACIDQISDIYQYLDQGGRV